MDEIRLISGTDYYDKKIIRTDLTELILDKSRFSDCEFCNCDFSQVSLKNCRFANCFFRMCNLSNALIDGCRMDGVLFEECKMIGLNFSNCDTRLGFDINIRECNILLCHFSDLDMKRSCFKESVIHQSSFDFSDLRDADFSGSDLKDCQFGNADLRGADLRDARNYNINPMSAKVKGARFSIPEVLELLKYFEIIIE
ncbi:MAG: pentapeptide repeat-containing protein [Candidatus Muiribacteriaceae bacterium]